MALDFSHRLHDTHNKTYYLIATWLWKPTDLPEEQLPPFWRAISLYGEQGVGAILGLSLYPVAAGPVPCA